MTGNVKKFTKNKGYESLNRNMLQDVDNLSLDAIGLLSNLTSYPDSWEIHKTELYKRYKKSGRRKVERAWNELVEQQYIVQLRRRKGKTYEYIYYHNQERFTEEDIKRIEAAEKCSVWDGKVSNQKKDDVPSDEASEDSSTVQNVQSKNKEEKSSTVHNEQYKMDSTKRTDKKLTIKEVYYQQESLDTLDTEDTKTLEAASEETISSSSSQKRKKRKQQYTDEAFYANQERVPKRISEMLHAFFDSTEEAEKYYNLILTAKKNAELDTGITLWLENEPEIEQEIIHTFSRAVRKIEKERNVTNPNGYLYKAIHQVITETVNARLRVVHYTNDERFSDALNES